MLLSFYTYEAMPFHRKAMENPRLVAAAAAAVVVVAVLAVLAVGPARDRRGEFRASLRASAGRTPGPARPAAPAPAR